MTVGLAAAVVIVTMSSSVDMEGIPSRGPVRVVMTIKGDDLTVDVDLMGQSVSMKTTPGRSELGVSLKRSGNQQTFLGRRCEASSFEIRGHASGNARMITRGTVWIATRGPRIPTKVSAPPRPAFGLPGGDFETFVALLSHIGGVPCRIESQTALDGQSEIVEALKLPIKVTAVLTALEGRGAKD